MSGNFVFIIVDGFIFRIADRVGVRDRVRFSFPLESRASDGLEF